MHLGPLGASAVTQFVRNFARLRVWWQLGIIGLPVAVLGTQTTGKTSLINLLQDAEDLKPFDPRYEATRPTGVHVGRFKTDIGGRTLHLMLHRDVSGETPESWMQYIDSSVSFDELKSIRSLRELRDISERVVWTYPVAIVYLLDPRDAELHRPVLRSFLEQIDKRIEVKRHLKVFALILNKTDQLKNPSEEARKILAQYSTERSVIEESWSRFGISFQSGYMSVSNDRKSVDQVLTRVVRGIIEAGGPT